MKPVALLALVLAASACGGAPPPPVRMHADVKQIMASIVDPAADVVWEAVGTIDTPGHTEEIRPETNEDWDAVKNSAWVLVESSNLLLIGNRPKDTGDWTKFAQDLADESLKAVKAAEARDAAALFTAGGDVYQACTNCHAEYNIDLRRPAGQ